MRIRRTYEKILNPRNVLLKIDNDTWDKAGEVLKSYGLSRQDYLRVILAILLEKGEPSLDVIEMIEIYEPYYQMTGM